MKNKNINNKINLRNRAGVILYYNNNILLMYRKKPKKTYYTFPGGTIEGNETIEEAAIREVKEETSIIATPNRLIYHLKINDIKLDNNNLGTKNEYLVLCNYISGVPSISLNAIEQQRKNDNNIYKPMWVPIQEIKKLLLYPLEVRDLLLKDFKTGFNADVKKIEVTQSDLKNN